VKFTSEPQGAGWFVCVIVGEATVANIHRIRVEYVELELPVFGESRV